MTARIVSGERVEPGPGFARRGAFVAGLDRSPKSSRSAKRPNRPPRRSKADAKRDWSPGIPESTRSCYFVRCLTLNSPAQQPARYHEG